MLGRGGRCGIYIARDAGAGSHVESLECCARLAGLYPVGKRTPPKWSNRRSDMIMFSLWLQGEEWVGKGQQWEQGDALGGLCRKVTQMRHEFRSSWTQVVKRWHQECLPEFLFGFFVCLFYFLVVSHGMRDLSFLTRDRARAPCTGSLESFFIFS